MVVNGLNVFFQSITDRTSAIFIKTDVNTKLVGSTLKGYCKIRRNSPIDNCERRTFYD